MIHFQMKTKKGKRKIFISLAHEDKKYRGFPVQDEKGATRRSFGVKNNNLELGKPEKFVKSL